ncbi:MAG: DUF1844 domain-containing protein [Thermoanaerobaculia bacterium]
MPDDKKESSLKVTDKRIFTSEGEIREEYRDEVKPSNGPAAAPSEEKKAAPEPPPQEPPKKKRSIEEQGANPGTPFTNFVESLIVNGYMSLGMLRNPYQPEVQVDVRAAKQMIDIIDMLGEKTRGNLTQEEQEFLELHRGELKLAYVQRSKTI